LFEPLPAPFQRRLFICILIQSSFNRPVVRTGKRDRTGRSRVAHDEALARDEQIGNAAIQRRRLAPAARSA